MVVIRMARRGAKHRPFYNIVVADSRSPRDGRFIERVGFYNTIAEGAAETLRFYEDRLNYWLSEGAQMSPSVKKLVKQSRRPAQPQSEASKKAESSKTAVSKAKVKESKVEEAKVEASAAETAV